MTRIGSPFVTRQRVGLLLAALMLALSAWPGAVLAQDAGGASLPAHVVDKIDDVVLTAMAEAGSASFIVLMADQADLSRAYQLRSKEEKGRFVFETLRTTAEHSQAGLLAELKDRGVAYHSLYVVNALVVEQGDLSLAAELAARSDVARLVANPTVQQPLPELEAASPDTSPEAIEWGVSNVNAPQVWSTYGITGTGITIAGQDTGIRWTHNALKSQYRGWDGANADHNYNWWDAIHADLGAANPCGINLTVPCDDNGHGTHTVGTVVGDDGGSNQIGVAPGAQWIGCRNMESGFGTPTTYAECFQFFLAPTDLAGSNPNPALAPHVINNSWGCPTSEGCTSATWGVIQAVQQNLRAAGVLVVASAGNDGTLGCGSINTPLAIFPESFAVGAFSNNVNYPIASFSSRGPRAFTNLQGPDISAPGVSVRSATRSNDTAYGTSSGTSMAGPHVVGVAALLWSAVPGLVGQVPATEQYLRETAVKSVVGTTCGSGANTAPWNTWDNAAGYGRVDALAAVQAALCPADINYDDVIDVVDISLLASQWNLSLGDAGYNPRRDLDFDNAITVADIVTVAAQWQTSCTGS